MDLLYSRYASPEGFMHLYIEQGRFGEFVKELLELDHKRKKEEVEKESDDKLFEVYLRSGSDKNFNDWKNDIMHGLLEQPKEAPKQMTAEDKKNQAVDIVNASTNILENFNLI